MSDMKYLVEQFENDLLSLDFVGAQQLFEKAGELLTTYQVVDQLIAPSLTRIGEGWETGLYSLSQIYMAGTMCEELVNGILPEAHPERKRNPRAAIAVLEDSHQLGKRIVYAILRAVGYEITDFGSVDVRQLVERVAAHRTELLLVSTLLLPSALRVKVLRRELLQAGLHVKIVVGGAPFNFDPLLWREVEADAMGRNAADSVDQMARVSASILADKGGDR